MTVRPDDIPQELAVPLQRLGLPEQEQRAVLATSLLSISRLMGLAEALELTAHVPGDTAEVGVAHGGTSRLIAKANGGRVHWACDTFQGLVDAGEHDTLTNGQFSNPREKVEAALAGCGNVCLVPGYFPGSAPAAMRSARFRLVHVDVDTYQSIRNCFAFFATRMAPGGVLVLDDVIGTRGCAGAVKAFAEIRKARSGGWAVINTANPPQAVVRFS